MTGQIYYEKWQANQNSRNQHEVAYPLNEAQIDHIVGSINTVSFPNFPARLAQFEIGAMSGHAPTLLAVASIVGDRFRELFFIHPPFTYPIGFFVNLNF